MSIRISNLPQGTLPLPEVHFHKAAFIIPKYYDQVGRFKLAQAITGASNPVLWKEYGGRYNYLEYFTLRNGLNEVLATFYTSGTGNFQDTTMVVLNGLCFETWNSHNPLSIDVVSLIKFVIEAGGWFTSLDLAKNDYRRVIDWVELVFCAHKTNFRDRLVLRMNKIKPPCFMSCENEGLYFGSSKSRTQVYCYVRHEKGPVYQGRFGQETLCTKFPWIRIEAKLRGKAQCQHVAAMILEGSKTLDELTAGILAYLLDFKEAGILAKHKRPSLRWWTQFVGTEKINPNPPKLLEEDDLGFDLIEF